MKTIVLTILFFCTAQLFYSQQEDGVVSLALPVRNSLTYNQFAVNPTFSFVRQQNKYVSITNKREWMQFDDAPLTYLVGYSGRFRENIGAGINLFQQNYGILTTFGGILNFSYNAQLNTDSNLTFGINVGAYSSGINNGRIVTNEADPSLNNMPSNFLLSVSPGINYGTAFLDFGVSLNNAILYNFSSSELFKEDPEQSIQGHIMYTGYMYSNSFLDESKFTGRIIAQFKDDNTVFSGTAMLTIPLGIWAQAGYNTLYGVHGGVGLNITKNISVEYNYEKAMGDLSNFGSAHELTLAYKFNNKERYDYSREDDVSALIAPTKKKNTAKPTNTRAEENRKATELAKEQERLAVEDKAQQEAQEKARLAAEAKAQQEAQEKARLAAEAKAQQEAQEQARLAAEAKAQQEAQEQERLAAEAKAQQEAQEQERLAAEAKAQQEAQEKARLAAEAKAQQEAQEQARLAAEAKAQQEAQEKARLAAEAKAQQEAQEQERLAAEAKAQQEAQEQERLATEAKAQQEAQEQARLAAEAKAQQEAEEQARLAENDNMLPNANDTLGKSMNELAQSTEDSKKTQSELLAKLQEVVDSKNQDLKDLKEENDLSEQGIYMEPKPFKSISAENRALEAIKTDLDNTISNRSSKIKELEELYEQRQRIDTIEMDEISLFYKKTIKKLKAEQAVALKTKSDLEAKLVEIRIATDYERKRRIKRAAYKNEEDRFAQDKATLKVIRENTTLSNTPLTKEDFDFGEERSGNIEILKNIQHVEEGYYMILAVHNDVNKRDEFLRKAVASGQKNINFFYDVNTSKYYIYYEKFDSIQSANEAQQSKGSKPYNGKISIVKIEN